MRKKVGKFMAALLIGSCLLSLTGCAKECVTDCGNKADSQCSAEMCDTCCSYWHGLNGCFKDH